MEFGGEHGDFGELLEAAEGTMRSGEKGDQDYITLINTMIF